MTAHTTVSLADAHTIACSAYFEPEHYRAQVAGPVTTDFSLAQHYLSTGAKEGLDPSPYFSTVGYLDNNADVRKTGFNPLLHFLRYGRDEGRTAVRPQEAAVKPAGLGREASGLTWDEFTPPPPSRVADVTIVVPVYLGFEDTLACIRSVLAAPQNTPYRLVVVDDDSPDKELKRELRALEEKGLIELVVRAKNGGFVEAVNEGMSLRGETDVVLLNSDTLVYGAWLDRLRAAAYKSPDIGTVTPLTNNGEIASYPRWCEANHMALELSDAGLNALLGELDLPLIPAPTAVGFCMYIRGECLDQAGLFDLRFNPGYGEENDFSRRLIALGKQNVITANVFVRHHGSVSFGAKKMLHIRRAMALLKDRHPTYEVEVHQYIRARPHLATWRAIDLARLDRLLEGKRILYVSHARGGGTAQHMDEMKALLAEAGVSVVTCIPDGDRVRLIHEDLCETPSLAFEVSLGFVADFSATLKALNIRHVHVHSLVDFPASFPSLLREALASAALEYDYTVHDYAPICPRIDLNDRDGSYCGEPPTDECDKCVAQYGSQIAVMSTAVHRSAYDAFLTHARRVFTPSADALQRTAKYFPAAKLYLRPHAEANRSGPGA